MAATIRDTLFGDQPVEEWPPHASEFEPWLTFWRAAQALKQGDEAQAKSLWKHIAAVPGLESRHTIQAWTFLRRHGERPPAAIATTVYGVVAEVMMEQGLDLLAAYADYSARYYNFSGAGVVWEHPDNRLDPAIRGLLDAGRQIVHLIGPWEDVRPGPPPINQARISMLTPNGLYFGQGSLAGLSADSNGKRLVDAATDLLTQITNLNTR